MPEIRIKLPKLHPTQELMLAQSRRYNVGVCGRRFGKTFMSADILIDGPRKKGAVHGYPVALYAPTYQTMLESWRKLVEILKPITEKKSEQDKRIDLITGGVVEFWSLDNPDAGRGRKYATVVIDEAAMIKRLEEAWTQNIQPLLLDFQGEAWFISTPKGRNYFETLFNKGDPSNPERDDDWMSWQIPTWNNPYISRDDIEKMRLDMPRLAFLQEIEAQFVSFAGTFVKAEHIHTGTPPEGMTLYMGVDLALSMKENADYTAIVVVGVDKESGRVWIVDAERRRVGFRDALAFIEQKAARWRPVDILVEAVQFQAVVVDELLRSTDLPVRKVHPDKDKLTRAQGLITRYENHLVWHNDQMGRDYTEEILSFGPDADHDDMVDAAVYAYMASGDFGRATFFIPDSPAQLKPSAPLSPENIAVPKELTEVMNKMVIDHENTCSSCINRDRVTNHCSEVCMKVRPTDPACWAFIARA